MILSDVRNYIQRRGQASLADVATHFDADPEAVRGMLEIWVRKGKLSRRAATSSCGSSCSECDSAVTEIYVWQSKGLQVDPPLPPGCHKQDS